MQLALSGNTYSPEITKSYRKFLRDNQWAVHRARTSLISRKRPLNLFRKQMWLYTPVNERLDRIESINAVCRAIVYMFLVCFVSPSMCNLKISTALGTGCPRLWYNSHQSVLLKNHCGLFGFEGSNWETFVLSHYAGLKLLSPVIRLLESRSLGSFWILIVTEMRKIDE